MLLHQFYKLLLAKARFMNACDKSLVSQWATSDIDVTDFNSIGLERVDLQKENVRTLYETIRAV